MRKLNECKDPNNPDHIEPPERMTDPAAIERMRATVAS